jgi:signal transduction histidine kinase
MDPARPTAVNPSLLSELSHRLLWLANESVPRREYLRAVLDAYISACACERAELCLRDDGHHICARLRRGDPGSFRLEHCSKDDMLGLIANATLDGSGEPGIEDVTAGNGALLIPASRLAPALFERLCGGDAASPGDWAVAIVPIIVARELVGVLGLAGTAARGFFAHPRPQDDTRVLEEVCQTLGLALANQRSQSELRERVKELTCMYGIAKLTAAHGISQDDLLQGIANLLPPAWLHPEATCARIVVDGNDFRTPGFIAGPHELRADIVAGEALRGFVQVVIAKPNPEMGANPFLDWEEHLIRGVASQIALILERRYGEDEARDLQAQLRHADRLATIGQLAAGVAHELNEPLANILGFAQLALKSPDLPDQASGDLRHIESASLHAREVIRKLMFFARQIPQRSSEVDLNRVVEDGLYFLASRCVKAGVELVKAFAPDLPRIHADPSQLNQVLVNLVVNAIQAMPQGGRLTIRTSHDDGAVTLEIVDTGTGMSEEVASKCLLPFFTTKDVNQGTGLGLSVVHGIVTSHGGSVDVESRVGVGSRFAVHLPIEKQEPRESEDSGV